jgi:hypothetical protein
MDPGLPAIAEPVLGLAEGKTRGRCPETGMTLGMGWPPIADIAGTTVQVWNVAVCTASRKASSSCTAGIALPFRQGPKRLRDAACAAAPRVDEDADGLTGSRRQRSGLSPRPQSATSQAAGLML